MKKIFLILLFIGLISAELFAQRWDLGFDPELQPDGTYLYPAREMRNAEDLFVAIIGDVDLANIDIRNKNVQFVTRNPHIFADFNFYFHNRYVERIIAEGNMGPSNMHKFPSTELYRIWQELERRLRASNNLSGAPYSFQIISNTRYGFLVKNIYPEGIMKNDNGEWAIYFFEIKTQ